MKRYVPLLSMGLCLIVAVAGAAAQMVALSEAISAQQSSGTLRLFTTTHPAMGTTFTLYLYSGEAA